MATVIQIKRSANTSAPSELGQGELAYTYGTGTQGNNGDRLFVGTGTETNGVAANIDVIGGKYFTSLIDHVPGTLTASSGLLVDSNKAIDEIFVGNSTTVGGTLKLNEGTNNGTNFIGLKAPNAVTTTTTFTLPDGDGSNGQFLKTDGSGNLSFGTVVSTLSLAADTGSSDSVSTGETITFTGGEGIDTSVTDNTITIAAEDATDTNKGIASFDATDFTVSSGDVTLNAERVQDIAGAMFGSNTETLITATYQDADGTIDLVVDNDLSNYDNSSSGFITASTTDTLTNKTINASQLVDGSVSSAKIAGDAIDGTKIADDAIDSEHITDGSVDNVHLANSSITIGSDSVSLGATQTDLNGITSLDVDNITIDGNTVSTTNSNGDLVLDPNGTGDVDVNDSKIINVATPTASTDAANKAYVDGVVNGLDVKDSVRYASTANVAGTYDNGAGTITAGSNGAFSIDGQTPSASDRVLLKDQSDATENGIYVVTTVGDGSSAYVLTRGPDADTAAEITGGTFFFVEEGSANADNGYVATHNGTPTLGTTDITFSQFSGAGQISAGNALTKTGNTLDVAVDDSTIEVSSDALQVKASGITSTELATNAVTTIKITDANVTNAKLANSTITLAGDSGSNAVYLGDTLTVSGGEGIDTSQSGDTLTIAAELATTSNKGVASFNSANFTVTSGDVTVTEIDGGTF